MKKIYRLVKSDDFANVIKVGKTIKNEAFTLHYSLNNENHIRIGISASTKLGHAVVRVKIRRQIRAICDQFVSFNSPFDILIIAKPSFLKNSYQTNNDLLCNLLKKIKGNIDEKEN